MRDPDKAAAWAQRGVELIPGTFTDAPAIAAGLAGVDAAFLMLPPFFTPAPGFPEAQAIIATYKAALNLVSPPRLVVLSSIGSQQTSRLGMITSTHLLEKSLGELRIPIAFLRAGSFLENCVPAMNAAATSGWFDSYLNRPVPMVASEDIGNHVAHLLTSAWTGQKIVELGSRVSPDDLASAISEALGRPVRARIIPRDQWTATLQSQGLPPAFIAPFTEMEDGFNSGWIDFGLPGTEAVAATLTPAQLFQRLP